MKRLLVLVVAAVLLSACAGAHVISAVGPTQMNPSVRAAAELREHRAALKAHRLLRRIPLPAGARPTRVPSSLRTSDLGVSVLTEFAYVHRAVLVPKPLDAVARFVKENPVPGYENHTGALNSIGFDREPAHGWPMQRMYNVSFAPAGRHGWTVVKEEAAAAWLHPRSPKDGMPSGVREIDIRGGGVSEHVRDAAKIARIVRWFDALAPAPHVTVGCMAILSTRIAFVFRDAGGHALATASVPSQGTSTCNPIEFTRGARQTALVDRRFGKYALAARVERLLGVCFRDPTRKCR
jgi:hypothetical protein